VSPDGTLTYTLAPNANGSATVTVTLRDDGGTRSGGDDTSDPQAFTITALAVNDAPAGTDRTVTTPEGTDYTFTPADFGFSDLNDSPADDFAAVVIVTTPLRGTLERDGVPVGSGQVITAADIQAGMLKFIPGASESGAPYASFTFKVQDDGGQADGGQDTDPSANTMTINVTRLGHAPEGTDGTVQALEDTEFPFSVGNFGFTDLLDMPPDDLLNVIISTLPTAGTLKLNGVAVVQGQSVSAADIDAGLLRFITALNGNGTPYASFTFQVQDDGGGQNTDLSPNTMTIHATAWNDAPTVSVPGTQAATATQDLTFSTAHGNAITVADVDGNALTVTIAVTGNAGNVVLTLSQNTGLTGVTGNTTASVSFTGSATDVNAALNGLTFKDAAAESGLTFTITVNDGTAPIVSDSFTIHVNP
jgi:hypothetical protein